MPCDGAWPAAEIALHALLNLSQTLRCSSQVGVLCDSAPPRSRHVRRDAQPVKLADIRSTPHVRATLDVAECKSRCAPLCAGPRPCCPTCGAQPPAREVGSAESPPPACHHRSTWPSRRRPAQT